MLVYCCGWTLFRLGFGATVAHFAAASRITVDSSPSSDDICADSRVSTSANSDRNSDRSCRNCAVTAAAVLTSVALGAAESETL